MTWTGFATLLLLCAYGGGVLAKIKSYDHDDKEVQVEFGGITNYETDIRKLEAWKNVEGDGDVMEPLLRWVDPQGEGNAERRDKRFLFGTDTSQCAQDMAMVYDVMSEKHTSFSESPGWQRQMVDSWSGVPAGVTHAHIVWSGDYYECVKLKVWRNANKTLDRKPDIVGKYCLGSLGVIIVATPLRAGYCIPESCSKFQAQMVFGKNKLPFRIFVDDFFCQTEAAPAWDSTSTKIWWLFAVLITIVVLATIYDVFLHLREWCKTWRDRGTMMISMKNLSPSKPKQSRCLQLILSFSAYANTKKILDLSPATDDATYLSSLHGIKAITMSWVVMGHCCVMLNQLFAWKNGVDILEFLKSFWLQAIGGAEFSVDTFITITGFLVVYVVMRETKKHGQSFNPLVFYAHRIIRLWPPFALLIAYTCGIAAHMPRGPISPAAFKDQEICRKVWWKALLFIQVYYGEKEKCLPHIWYLCIDLFFVVVSPLFLFPLIKKPKVGYGVLSILLVISIGIPFTLIHLHDLGAFPARNVSAKKREQFMHEVYDVPWGRMHCFIIGAAAGYIYYKHGQNLRLSKIFVVFMWLFSASTMFAMVFGTLPYSSGRKPMSHNMSVFYGTFTRPVWSIGISWIIISGATGYAGWINRILSFKGFIPFSRLSYSAYLVHFSVIGHLVASAKQPYMVDLYFMLFMIVSVFLVTMVLAWFMAVLIEAPVIQAEGLLMRIVLDKLNKPKQPPQPIAYKAAAKKIANEPEKLIPFAPMTNGPVPVPVPQQTEMIIESDSEVFWDITESNLEKSNAI